jgi:beta-glucanase (GH16 family)
MIQSRPSTPRVDSTHRYSGLRVLLIGVATLALAFGLVVRGQADTSLAAAGQSPDFQDTFDGTTIDTSKWGLDYPWDENNVSTCRRGELQCYEPQQVTESGGMLNLTARPVDTTTVPPRRDSAHPYASGLIQSDPSAAHNRTGFATTYGYFEMSAKLTNAQASWPAFWLVPTDLGWPPELDIMESLGQSPSRHSCTYHPVGGGAPQAGDTGVDKSQGFHTYALRWGSDSVQCILDGRVIGTFANPPAKPMYMILNLAVGGYAGTPDPSQYPATFQVDYVRAWRNPDVVPGPPPEAGSNHSPAPAPTPPPTPAPPTPAPPPEAASGNLITNPSFETDASHWAGWHASVSTIRSESAPEGQSVARVGRLSGNSYSIGERPQAVASVTAGSTYAATAYVAAASAESLGKPVVLAVRERNRAGAIVAVTESSPTSLRSDFQRITTTGARVRQTGDTIDLYLIQFHGQSGDAFYTDMFYLSSCASSAACSAGATESLRA